MDATTRQRTTATLIPLGLHFGLDAERYHADPALGSTDLRRLAKNPHNYWYYSWMNPKRPRDRQTEAQIRGSAMHKIVFEGLPAFLDRYLVGEDQGDMSTAERMASTKALNVRALAEGKTPIKYEDYERGVIAAAMITEAPELATAFTGGASEVSFFWMRDGLRFKARFDYLKCTSRSSGMTAGIGDLKTVANQYENDFEQECRNRIGRDHLDAQAAHYLEALKLVPAAIEEGLVNNWVPAAGVVDLISRLSQARRFGWQWVFHQTEGAPITLSWSLSPANPMVEVGQRVIACGVENYRLCMAAFGVNKMWALRQQVREIDIEGMPAWYGRTDR